MTVAEALSMLMDTPAGDLQTTVEIKGEWVILDPKGAVPRVFINPEQGKGEVTPERIVRGDGTDTMPSLTPMRWPSEDLGRFERLFGHAQMNGEDL